MTPEKLSLIESAKEMLYQFALFGVTAQQRSLIEQHIGTILQVAVVGLLGWSLTTSVALQRDVGVLQSQITSMQTTLAQGTNDRYRGSDAARDQAVIWADLNRKEDRISRLEETLNKHRADVAGMGGMSGMNGRQR